MMNNDDQIDIELWNETKGSAWETDAGHVAIGDNTGQVVIVLSRYGARCLVDWLNKRIGCIDLDGAERKAIPPRDTVGRPKKSSEGD